MRGKTTVACALAACATTLGLAFVQAQGRGGSEWTTSSFDAQRTGSIRTDPRISVETMQKPGAFGAFKFLWKMKIEDEPGARGALTQPILLDRVIGFRGFKSIAFVGTSSETVHAVDTDLGVPLWKYHINYSASPPPIDISSAACPGGLTASLSRPTSLAPPPPGGRAGGGRGGRSGGGVGEPGKGSITLATAGQPRGGGAAASGGRGGAPGAALPGSAAAAAGVARGALPRGGGAPGGGFIPGTDAAYVVGSDGYLHALNIQNGWENMPPALFLPANTRATGLIITATPGAPADGGAVAYAATTHGCGSQPDAVWAMDLASPEKTVNAFQAKGALIAGSAGPAFGRNGSVYVATTNGKSPLSNAVIALEPGTLKLEGSATVPGADFASSPLVFTSGEKDILAVAGGGKLFLFDSSSLSSGPIATSASYGPADFQTSALTSWEDAQGVRWIAAPSSRGIVAMKVTEQSGKFAFLPGWTSREIAAPLTPIEINGVVFAASGGTRAAPGVLYAIDAATGTDLWNSAKAITSTVRGGLSGGQGNVYVTAADGTLYAFGFAIEK
jgi:outer membrane protein assembly factor BamB